MQMWHKQFFSIERVYVWMRCIYNRLIYYYYYYILFHLSTQNQKLYSNWNQKLANNNNKKWSRFKTEKQQQQQKSSNAICFYAIVFNLFSAYRKLNLLILFKRI